MRRFRSILAIGATIGLLFGCDGGEETTGTGDPGPEGSNVVLIEDDIEDPTVWSGDSVYVIMAYDFYVMNTLTIEPGTVVKFHPTDGPYLMLSGAGVINAVGTADSPIVFTSYRDDAHGGDTNGDGAGTQPASKDWGEINTNGLNGSTFAYCHFYYGGSISYRATLTIYGDHHSITNCVFAHNDGSYTSSSGDVGVLDASYGEASTVIEDNVFFDNVRPLSISCDFSLDNSNVFHDPDADTVVNTYNGIFVETNDHVTLHVSWEETEVAFVIDDGDFWINSGATLTLGDNVTIKYKSGSVMLLESGVSALPNYDGPGVFFTSWNDDARKGDTNGDGSASTPADGYWEGIYDNSLTIPSPYFYQWGNILYDSY